MMFYLSKIVWGVFQPSSLLIVFFAAGSALRVVWKGEGGGAPVRNRGRSLCRFRLFAPGKLGAGAP